MFTKVYLQYLKSAKDALVVDVSPSILEGVEIAKLRISKIMKSLIVIGNSIHNSQASCLFIWTFRDLMRKRRYYHMIKYDMINMIKYKILKMAGEKSKIYFLL